MLRYRVGGREQTPLVVGLVADFPTEDEALLEVDRLGLRVRINCASSGTRRVKLDELAEYYLKVEFDPEVTARPKSENTKPILKHYVRNSKAVADRHYVKPSEVLPDVRKAVNDAVSGLTGVQRKRKVMSVSA